MNNQHEIILYQMDDTNVCVSVYYEGETFWLTTKAMAELFGVKTQAITKHLGNIYEEEELIREATCSKKEQVQIEGDREVHRMVDFYNLDAIIAVGYRVNSKKATRFRQWATKTLKEYMWAVDLLYVPGNSLKRFGNILEHNLRPIYDSAILQGYEIWK